MAKRYGIASPEDLERQERERRRKEAEYQALLMPDPTQTEPGLETVTPFFDILSGGVGGLGMKVGAKLGGLLGKKSGSGVLTQVPRGTIPPGTFEKVPPGVQRDASHFGYYKRAKGTKPEAEVFDLNKSPYDMTYDEFNKLSPTLQSQLYRYHKIDPEDLLGHHYKTGGREQLVNLYEYSKMQGFKENAARFKGLLDKYDRQFGLNIERFPKGPRGFTPDYSISPDDPDFWNM